MNTLPVSEFLHSLAGHRVYLDPLFGNHGDRLIAMGAEHLLDKALIQRVRKPADAEWLLVNGGGGMAEGWRGLDIVRDYSERYPDTPLAVLPSSFLFRQAAPERWFKARRAPLYLWARERPSFELIRNLQPGCEYQACLDHDLAFALADHPVLTGLRGTGPERVLLAVERDDWEGPTGRTRPLSLPGLGFIPEAWRNALRKVLAGPLRRRQDRASAFCPAAADFAAAHWKEHDLALRCADVSLGETCTFEEFLAAVASASVIVTTRLHVAILGHLLQRRVALVEGSYHKNRGVFEYSLGDGTTQLLRWENGRLR